MTVKKIYALAFCTLLMFCGCKAKEDNSGARPKGPTDTEEPGAPETPTDKPLKEAATYPVGSALTPGLLRNDQQYADIVKREMNSVTAENEMKMVALSSARGTYTFDKADEIVAFAADNGMRVHGHVLVWYREDALPGWVKTFAGDRDAWIAMLEEYIRDVMTHFKGKVASWDVVNEAFNDDGTWRTDCVWYQNIGQDYMDIAFAAARSADPEAILFYNDYGTEYSEAKRNAIAVEIEAMKFRGVPVQGVGLQMHISRHTTKNNLAASLRAAAETGLLVHVSELDVAINDINNPDPNLAYTQTLANEQKAAYKALFEAYKETVPAPQQFGVTFWGVDDNHSWLTNYPDWPLPFDRNYEPKPAYEGIQEALGGI